MKSAALAVALLVAGATPEIDRFFADFAAKRGHIDKLEARFNQETITPDETTRAVGRIVYERPRRILLQYMDPEVVYLVDGTRVYQYNAELQQVQIYDLDADPQLEALFLGFDDDTSRLREAYTVGLFQPEASSCGKQALRLIPLLARPAANADQPEEEVTPLFEEVELFLREEDYLPCRIHVQSDADSETDITVNDFKINEAAANARAQIELPEGTMIVDNEVLVETVGPGGKRIPEASPAAKTGEPATATPAGGSPATQQ